MVIFFPLNCSISSSSNMNLFIFKWFKFSFGGLSTGQTKAYFNILAWTPEKVLQVFVLAILQKLVHKR